MLDQALLVPGRVDLPDFLQADAELWWFAALVEAELCDQLLGQAAACTLGKQCVLAEQFHAAGVGILVRTVACNSHVAGGDAANLAVFAVDHFGRGKSGVDLDAEG